MPSRSSSRRSERSSCFVVVSSRNAANISAEPAMPCAPYALGAGVAPEPPDEPGMEWGSVWGGTNGLTENKNVGEHPTSKVPADRSQSPRSSPENIASPHQ